MILILLRIVLMFPLRLGSASLCVGALLVTGSLSGCAALTGADQTGTQVAAAFYPLKYVARAGRRRPRRRRRPDPARQGTARPRADHQGDDPGRQRGPAGPREGVPAGRGRRDRGERDRRGDRRGSRCRPAYLRGRLHRPALLAGPDPDGRGRRRGRRPALRARPRPRCRLHRQRRRPPGRSRVARRGVRRGTRGLPARHGRGVARRVRLPREVRSRDGAHRRPLPRRRADPGRPRTAAGTDRPPRASPRSSPSVWSAPASPSRSPGTWASAPPSSIPSKGCRATPRTTTTSP